MVARYSEETILKFFRTDAAFANPQVYEFLEGETFFYAIRLPSNSVLKGSIVRLLTRPVRRPPKKPVVLYHSFLYQAGNWDRPRRVVVKVKWHQSELFPRFGYVLTNLKWSSRRVVR